jgi:hypothetical protein
MSFSTGSISIYLSFNGISYCNNILWTSYLSISVLNTIFLSWIQFSLYRSLYRSGMPCLLGAITFFNQTKGEQSCWASLIKDIYSSYCAKIDVWLNLNAIHSQYFNAILMTFNSIQYIQATLGITGSFFKRSSHSVNNGTSMSAYHHQNL